MTHRMLLASRSFGSLPIALGMIVSGLACSPRDDIAEPAADDRGGSSGSAGNAGDAGMGGTLTTGGTMSSGGSQGGNGGTGGSNDTGGASATGGTPTGGASGAGAVVGCDASNTILAPEDGLILTFMGADGVIGEMGSRGFPLVAYEVADGELHIALNAPVGSDILSVGYQFESCLDATAFDGVEFSVSGSLANCPSAPAPEAAIGLVVRDSAHVVEGARLGSHGTGPVDAIPPHKWLTVDQVTSEPQTVRIPFAVFVGLQPPAPFDETKLTGVGWAFAFPGTCIADITIDDVRFY